MQQTEVEEDHPLVAEDDKVMHEIRAAAVAGKGHVEREPFDANMERTPGASGITYEAGVVGGISGIWCRPVARLPGAVVLYLHGGAYIAGTAHAFRHLAGQIAARTGADTFVPDYRLAPEHRFPAALDDARAAYRGLIDSKPRALALAGDSAGGGLALALLAVATSEASENATLAPCGCAVMSPWTDLALRGSSLKTRADADPFLTRDALAAAAAQYLAGQDARSPLASPLYGDLDGLPPILVHTGMDEILLDDSRRYAERARAANVAVTLDTWNGMPHVFPSLVDKLRAANDALDAIGTFLRKRLEAR